jgi:DUF1680 family protein
MPWFGCSCCPTNVVRLFPALGGYIYAQVEDNLYVNLFVGSRTTVQLGGARVTIAQATDYPWRGDVRITVDPAFAASFTLRVRIPGWAQATPVPSSLYRYADGAEAGVELRVNDVPVAIHLDKGYACITRTWQPGDMVELRLPMPVRRVVSHEAVAENRGKVAVERGPLVYCLEGADNGGRVLERSLPDAAEFSVRWEPDLLHGINVISVLGVEGDLTFVPYYAWAHRGIGEMAVWVNDGA